MILNGWIGTLEMLDVDPMFKGIVHGIVQEHQIIAKMARTNQRGMKFDDGNQERCGILPR